MPADLPAWSTIPTWMLLYWGLILRFFVSLAAWSRLPAPTPRPRRALRLGLGLVLVVATRQSIYRLAADPVWSWLPFALALVIWMAVFPLDRRERALAVIVAVGGPLAEALLIGVGGLHHYRLGWLAGVPLWIALWWVLAVLLWTEFVAWLTAATAPCADQRVRLPSTRT